MTLLLVLVLIFAGLAYVAIGGRKSGRNIHKRGPVIDYGSDAVEIPEREIKLPYRVSHSVLTDAEKSFYHTLKLFVGERAVICPKIGLKDIFFISKEAGSEHMKYFGKIAQKHVDFVLCETVSMKPLCAIELDDISHTSKKSYERDQFIEKLYKDAGLELIRLSSKSGYTANEIETALMGVFDEKAEKTYEPVVAAAKNPDQAPLCPKCDVPMVVRKASKGKYEGKVFWGCPNFPKCRETYSGVQ
ncbi:MAG: DUF2726 domain-containing protein [Bacillota bacterium]|nr:DUF2726 domain-containing protein [Bacillota bacterium]MDW7678296.1 DUF2726 domain-containing protein [Bacillota bacterium]